MNDSRIPSVWVRRRRRSGAGQAILESAMVIILASMLAFGLIQVAQLMVAKSVMTYAAGAGARARAVGFNEFMTYKVVRAAAIPTAGALEHPVVLRGGGSFWGSRPVGRLWDTALRVGTPTSPQLAVEQPLIPLYLESDQYGRLNAILRYERWTDLQFFESGTASDQIELRTQQEIPLVFPFSRAVTLEDSVLIRSGDEASNHTVSRTRHSALYLE
ncbi:MAG: TadE/TadG family type IV pilus assembly protein [Kiritimatiellia bacterium]|nr:TadE/TadG family type IV pilus assembly protein [Kiritimatiellia bacterium]